MTLIGALGFPDEVIILSDSRRSYKNNVLPPKDDLKKIYQLSHHLCLAYTTDDIGFTSKLIEKITIFTSNLHHLSTNSFLKKTLEYVDKEYVVLSKAKRKSPFVALLYAGVDDKPLKIPTNKARLLIARFKRMPFSSIKFKSINLNDNNKYATIPGPTPILAKQMLPKHKITISRNWDFTVIGSGRGLEKEIEKYYKEIFLLPGRI